MLNNCALVLLVPTASLGSHSDFVGESIQDISFNHTISLMFYGLTLVKQIVLIGRPAFGFKFPKFDHTRRD